MTYLAQVCLNILCVDLKHKIMGGLACSTFNHYHKPSMPKWANSDKEPHPMFIHSAHQRRDTDPTMTADTTLYTKA